MKGLAFFLMLSLAARSFGAEYEINELPMYGGKHDPQVEPNAAASKDLAELGWSYLYRGDSLTAMKRFNQAWMFDRKNPDAFWGFGIIMGQRAKKENSEKNLIESVNLLRTAHELRPDDGRITGDLAVSYTLLGNYLKTLGKNGKQEHEKAEELFVEAYAREPNHAPIIYNWAVLKFHAGDYQACKKLISEAEKLGLKPDPELMKELDQKLR